MLSLIFSTNLMLAISFGQLHNEKTEIMIEIKVIHFIKAHDN